MDGSESLQAHGDGPFGHRIDVLSRRWPRIEADPA
jgi:hypothetical protein